MTATEVREWVEAVAPAATTIAVAVAGIVLARRLEQVRADVASLGALRTTAVQKRAEAAAALQVAALAFIEQIASATRFLPSPGDDAKLYPVLADGIDDNVAETKKHLIRFEERFFQAWAQADVHLPDEATALIQQVMDLHTQVWERLNIWLNAINVPEPDLEAHIAEDKGGHLRERATQLRQEVRAFLRPIAQMSRPEVLPATAVK